ncbi:MAG TPA: glycosyltransferase [Methylovirgula sp.]|nr:glycosyltransferase [Methylovirgula sp.]
MSYDLVVLGLSLSSSWGNGHATTYRALLKAYAARGHEILFLERDQPWYATHRDLEEPEFCRLVLYRSLAELERFCPEIAQARAVIVGSYVPEGIAVGRFVQKHARGVVAFYDIDTPVTLGDLDRCKYLSRDLIDGYDLYLSFTGGPILERLTHDFGARAAVALYCSVDPSVYRPTGAKPRYDLGYLGTYSPDRQPALERLLIEPARRAPHLSFIVGGPLYPEGIDWPPNVTRQNHVAPAQHPAFYGACRFALNLTRADMLRTGFSPSVRLFEAAACGTPLISDAWPGLETFFAIQEEILLAARTQDILSFLEATPEPVRRRLAQRVRRRVLGTHTAAQRARELELHIDAAQPHARRNKSEQARNDPLAAAFVS